jgi:hypothetical protein
MTSLRSLGARPESSDALKISRKAVSRCARGAIVWTCDLWEFEAPQVGIGGLAELAPNLPSIRGGARRGQWQDGPPFP